MKTTPTISRVLYYLLVFGLLSMAACNKDKDAEPKDPVQGSWQITAIKLDPVLVLNGIPIVDYIAALALFGDTCPQKIALEFKADKTVSATAPDECKATKDQLTGLIGIGSATTWKSENNMLVLTTSGQSTSADLAVDNSTMTLTSDATLNDGKVHKVTVSFKRL